MPRRMTAEQFWYVLGRSIGSRRATADRGGDVPVGRRYAGPCLTIMAHTRSTDRVRAVAHEMAERLERGERF